MLIEPLHCIAHPYELEEKRKMKLWLWGIPGQLTPYHHLGGRFQHEVYGITIYEKWFPKILMMLLFRLNAELL